MKLKLKIPKETVLGVCILVYLFIILMEHFQIYLKLVDRVVLVCMIIIYVFLSFYEVGENER